MENFSITALVSKLCPLDISEFPLETDLDLPYQRSITIDVIRTRSNTLTPEEKTLLEQLLTFYCKTEMVSYKQGMNEILAPFLLLNRQNIPLHVCYICFKNFVAKFIPTLFVDDSFKPLNGLFIITKLILKYHLPDISTCFNNNEITPDIYMTTWYVTMFSSKIKDLNLLYIFWQNLIESDDILYISYFGIALLDLFKQEIRKRESLNLPNVFKKICIENFETLQTVLRNTEKIKANTPLTAEIILKKYNMFCLESTDAFVEALKGFICLLILPKEIITQTYPHNMVCNCSDPKTCKIKKLNYILIDCRPNTEHKQGYFLNSFLLSKSTRKNEEKLLNYPKSFVSYTKNTHIALMGSNSEEEEGSVVQRLFNSFIQHEFPYVSIVDGGYPACHRFVMQHNLEIKSHKTLNCLACGMSEKTIVESTLNKFFLVGGMHEKPVDKIVIDPIDSEKIFRCSLDETQSIEDNSLGLIVTSSQLIVYNILRSKPKTVYEISKLKKISSHRNKDDVLYFNFSGDQTKQVFILKPTEVKEFLMKIRKSYQKFKHTDRLEKSNS
ncbi:hypothetical protein SteCoe_4614 [Stentor coeruleus]|uniref:TBC1 domain family member 23 n=1 Tax=Stentor coeruleus TaxID=5963 RepID=A0A1R2CUB9_9CILI|nr:hypothetical protein SteCoe_4614 [Stentor coeruleus]